MTSMGGLDLNIQSMSEQEPKASALKTPICSDKNHVFDIYQL